MDDVKAKRRHGEEATIYDVAQEAGVSISTVSLALNSPGRVKAATLDRIMAAIDELGYTPKAEAVLRARRGIGRIGVIAPFTSFPTETSRRLAGIMHGLTGEGHEIAVFDQESAATSRLMSLPVSRKVDGLIIVSIPLDDEVEQRLRHRATPTVIIDIDHPSVSSIVIDHAAGGSLVGRYLRDRGHEHVAYVGHRQEHEYLSQSRQKLEAFSAVFDGGLDVRNIEHSLQAAIAAGRDLLNQSNAPTAIFAHDDLLAAGVIMTARSLGRSVPEDVAVVGFNDTDLAEPLGLTTVSQPFEQSGRIAADVLLAQIAAPGSAHRRISLGVELIERTST